MSEFKGWEPPPMVCIKWHDAWSNSAYYNDDTYYDAADAWVVGFLCEENDYGVVVSKMAFPEGLERKHMTFIPWDGLLEWRDVE